MPFSTYLLDSKLSWPFLTRRCAHSASAKPLMRTLRNTEKHIARPKALWRSPSYLFGSMQMLWALGHRSAVAKRARDRVTGVRLCSPNAGAIGIGGMFADARRGEQMLQTLAWRRILAALRLTFVHLGVSNARSASGVWFAGVGIRNTIMRRLTVCCQPCAQACAMLISCYHHQHLRHVCI